jgi:hypothetical protein
MIHSPSLQTFNGLWVQVLDHSWFSIFIFLFVNLKLNVVIGLFCIMILCTINSFIVFIMKTFKKENMCTW